MARYFFHIKDGATLIKDQEGSELATPEAARLQALVSARELWANAIKSGSPANFWELTFVPMRDALPRRPSDIG